MDLILPEWPAPPWVKACATTRLGGVSQGCYASLNVGDHVGDRPSAVEENRDRLSAHLGLPEAPSWLRQVHGCTMSLLDAAAASAEADGAVAATPGKVCVVMTADCLPVLLCDESGSEVAAVHAGWRGLLGGVVDQAVRAMRCEPARLMAWLGPAIGPDAFEVGPEVREGFVADDPATVEAFRPRDGRWLADIFLIARLRLARLGVARVLGGGDCTFSQPERFFSYRRDGVTGRMASLIWLADRAN